MKIMLNGREIEVAGAILGYEQIAALAFEPTITFAKGHGFKPEGIVPRDGIVKVVDGLVITCARTGAA